MYINIKQIDQKSKKLAIPLMIVYAAAAFVFLFLHAFEIFFIPENVAVSLFPYVIGSLILLVMLLRYGLSGVGLSLIFALLFYVCIYGRY
jgi:hypothetical protein